MKAAGRSPRLPAENNRVSVDDMPAIGRLFSIN
jgi:hypothetical protein